MFAPSSTPITGRVIDLLSLKKSCRTFTTDVTSRISTWTRTNNVTWICRLSSWSSRPHWRTRFLCLGDGENSCTARDALEHAGYFFMAERIEEQSFDRCDAASQLFANVELAFFIEVHMDDLHGIRQRPTLDLIQTNFSQKDHFKIWTVYEVRMRYEHVKCERVLHDDRTYIVPNSKCFGVVLQSMVLTNCKQAPTPSVAG